MRTKLMLDSGAFSAWSLDDTINMDDYAAFIKQYNDYVDIYVGVDVIPGDKHTLRTPEQIALSARKSYENLQYMKDKGLHPIPVVHQGEPLSWLERYLEDKEPYIGFSRYRKAKESSINKWLDTCFDMIQKYRPQTKTHGFAFTSHDVLLRYPWTTADSTSWILGAGFGFILLPALNPEGPDFSNLTIMRISPRAATDSKIKYGMLNPKLKERVNHYIEEYVGVSIESVCNTSIARSIVNIKFFQGLQDHIRKVRNTKKFDIIYATSITQLTQLIEVKASPILLSYFELRKVSKDRLENVMSALQSSKLPVLPVKKWTESYLLSRCEDITRVETET